MSIAKPRSRCPRCASEISWFDNLPVLSWLFLRGKCRSCRARISIRYPLVELFVAALFVALALLLVGRGPALEYPFEHGSAWLAWLVGALIVSALVALSLIDLDYRILPDEITKSGIFAGPVLAFLAPGFQHGRYALRLFENSGYGERGNAALNGVLGVLVAGGVLWLIGRLGSWIFRKEAMGFGDVKMIAAMGGVLGLWALMSLMVAAMLGSVVGLVVKAVTRGKYIPFGPFLATGMVVVMVRGSAIFDAYVRLVTP